MNLTVDIPEEELSEIKKKGYDLRAFLKEAVHCHLLSLQVQQELQNKYKPQTLKRVDAILQRASETKQSAISEDKKQSNLQGSIKALRKWGDEEL